MIQFVNMQMYLAWYVNTLWTGDADLRF